MNIFKKISDIQAFLFEKRAQQLSIGFVPTMGALHDGHLSLLAACRKQCDIVVVSIFVNPTQFNDAKDLDKYPRTIEKDIIALTSAGCDVLFYPDVAEIYPPNAVSKHFSIGDLENVFEGEFRPGHFQGVCQVVDKLFSIVQPNKVFFGQKDYQQCMVIKKLIALTPAFDNIDMHIVPIKREQSGLAMSSRNVRLSEGERALATTIYQSLLLIQQQLRKDNLSECIQSATALLVKNGFQIDYVAITNAESLDSVLTWDGKQTLVILIAAFIGGVRLIDNLVVCELESCKI